MIDYVNGEEQIRSFVYSEWLAGSAAIIGYVPEMRFKGVELPDLPGKDKFWARLSVISFTDQQATLSTCIGTAYARRYRNNGQVVLQLFGPRTDKTTDSKLKKLAMLIQNKFRGGKTADGIWFRNAQIDASLASEDLFQRINVICDYERDEIK